MFLTGLVFDAPLLHQCWHSAPPSAGLLGSHLFLRVWKLHWGSHSCALWLQVRHQLITVVFLYLSCPAPSQRPVGLKELASCSLQPSRGPEEGQQQWCSAASGVCVYIYWQSVSPAAVGFIKYINFHLESVSTSWFIRFTLLCLSFGLHQFKKEISSSVAAKCFY